MNITKKFLFFTISAVGFLCAFLCGGCGDYKMALIGAVLGVDFLLWGKGLLLKRWYGNFNYAFFVIVFLNEMIRAPRIHIIDALCVILLIVSWTIYFKGSKAKKECCKPLSN